MRFRDRRFGERITLCGSTGRSDRDARTREVGDGGGEPAAASGLRWQDRRAEHILERSGSGVAAAVAFHPFAQTVRAPAGGLCVTGSGGAIVQGQIVAATAAGGEFPGRSRSAPCAEPAAGPADREKACADSEAERIEHATSLWIRTASRAGSAGQCRDSGGGRAYPFSSRMFRSTSGRLVMIPSTPRPSRWAMVAGSSTVHGTTRSPRRCAVSPLFGISGKRPGTAVEGAYLVEGEVADEGAAGDIGEFGVAGKCRRGIGAFGRIRVPIMGDDRVTVRGDLDIQFECAHPEFEGVGESGQGVLRYQAESASVGLEVENRPVGLRRRAGRAAGDQGQQYRRICPPHAVILSGPGRGRRPLATGSARWSPRVHRRATVAVPGGHRQFIRRPRRGEVSQWGEGYPGTVDPRRAARCPAGRIRAQRSFAPCTCPRDSGGRIRAVCAVRGAAGGPGR